MAIAAALVGTACTSDEDSYVSDVSPAVAPDDAEAYLFLDPCDNGGPRECDARILGEMCARFPEGLLPEGSDGEIEGLCTTPCDDAPCPDVDGLPLECVTFDDGFKGCRRVCDGGADCLADAGG